VDEAVELSRPPRPKRRRAWLLTALFLAFLAGLSVAAWLWAAAQLRAAVAHAVAAQRLQGRQITADLPVASGFPFHLILTYPDWRIQGPLPGLPVPLSWQSQQLRVQADLLHPRRATAEALGAQTVQLPGLPPLHLSAGLFHAESDAQGGLILRGQDLRSADGALRIASLTLQSLPTPQSVTNLSLTAQDIAVPPGLESGLGPRIASATLDAVLQGDIPPDGPVPSRLGAWRDAGGRLKLANLAIVWGPAQAQASGTLQLDEALQPAGTIALRLTGWSQAATALGQSGALDPRTARVVRAVLALLAGPAPGAATRSITLPFAVQHRILSVGNIPILNLPELHWQQD
jgi:hypothetical protein